MASTNEFKITIRGKGGHAPCRTPASTRCRSPARWCRRFQTIISRNKKPVDAGVISVTMIHAGEATNVVPDSCELQGTVRTFTLEVLDLIEQRMRHGRAHLRRARGCSANSTLCATTRPPSMPRPKPHLRAR
jgi:metal-dependent amidase/aminoacylase/carboxypeptidase family protein